MSVFFLRICSVWCTEFPLIHSDPGGFVCSLDHQSRSDSKWWNSKSSPTPGVMIYEYQPIVIFRVIWFVFLSVTLQTIPEMNHDTIEEYWRLGVGGRPTSHWVFGVPGELAKGWTWLQKSDLKLKIFFQCGMVSRVYPTLGKILGSSWSTLGSFIL
jgi:hypothetical protein